MEGLSQKRPDPALDLAALDEPSGDPSTAPREGRRAPGDWLWAVAPLSKSERLFWASCACLLCTHALFSGLVLDDFFILHQVGHASLLWGLLHAFDFTSDAADFADGLERGLWPWWTDAHAKLRFFRPLAALTHALDARLFHDAPWVMHAESLLILVLLTAAALKWFHTLFRDTPQVARVASVLYALAPGHALNASWLSGRNTCLASLFAILTLLAHHHARKARRLGLLVLSTACLIASLLSGELGSSALALLLAHACFLDRASWRERLLWLAPAVVTAACWLVLYVHGEYGVQASPIYVSLLQEPLYYLKSAAIRLPLLLFSSFGWPVVAFSMLSSGAAQALLALLSLACFGALAPWLVAALRSDERARFCAAAFGLSVLPALSTFPHERLLMIAELGAFPWLSLAVLRVPASAAFGRLGRGLLLSRVWLSVPLLLANGGSVWEWVRVQRRPFEVSLQPEQIKHSSLVFVNAPCALFENFLFYQREYENQPAPRRVRVLAQGAYGLTVRRIDDHTLSLRSESGLLQSMGQMRTHDGRDVAALSPGYAAQILNAVSLPDPRVPVGTQVRLSDLTLTVVEATPEGWPREMRAEFRAPLESEQLYFVQWKDDGWQVWPLPDVGQTVTLAPILR